MLGTGAGCDDEVEVSTETVCPPMSKALFGTYEDTVNSCSM